MRHVKTSLILKLKIQKYFIVFVVEQSTTYLTNLLSKFVRNVV